MRQEILIDRKAYDDLSEKVRLLTNLAEERSRRIKRLMELCISMEKEIMEGCNRVFDGVKSLEEALSKVRGLTSSSFSESPEFSSFSSESPSSESPELDPD
jgi:hypothetical protein